MGAPETDEMRRAPIVTMDEMVRINVMAENASIVRKVCKTVIAWVKG